MIEVVEQSHLPVPPARVWRFFVEEVEDSYHRWHGEHLQWRWLRGQPLSLGSTWFADEWVGRLRVSSRFVVSAAEPERFFAYKLCFPSSLVRARGSFRFEPEDGGCRLTQAVRMGFSLPIIGSALDRIIDLVAPSRELRRHMREEQASLGPLLAGR